MRRSRRTFGRRQRQPLAWIAAVQYGAPLALVNATAGVSELCGNLSAPSADSVSIERFTIMRIRGSIQIEPPGGGALAAGWINRVSFGIIVADLNEPAASTDMTQAAQAYRSFLWLHHAIYLGSTSGAAGDGEASPGWSIPVDIKARRIVRQGQSVGLVTRMDQISGAIAFNVRNWLRVLVMKTA